MMVEHYGANAVEIDGVLVSYKTSVARIGKSEWLKMEVENV